MRKLGCALGIFGAMLCIAGLALLGRSIFRATQARTVQTISIPLSQELRTDSIRVDTVRFCMISIRAKVESQHARKAPQDSSDQFLLEYAFPFRYTVYDAKNQVLASEKTELGDNDGKVHTKLQEHVTEQGGSVLVTSDYLKFPVAPPGQIRIEAQLDPDETYHATADHPELILYDNVSQHTKPLTIGIILMIIGGPLAVVGILFFLIGSVRRAESPPTSTPLS